MYLRSRRSRNRGGRRAMSRSGELRSDESYESVNARPHVRIISSFIKYRRSANEFKTNLLIRKTLTSLTLTQERTRMLRISELSEEFKMQDEIYCLKCRESMKSLLKRKPSMILLLFQRTYL